MAEFIVKENYHQHQSLLGLPDEYQDTVNNLFWEDAQIFKNSVFCIATRNEEIVGSVKITKWNPNIVLPIQKLFNIHPGQLLSEHVKSIWHIGRFAISKNAKDGASLLKSLISIAIYPICKSNKSLMLAECDSKFVRVLNLIGIQTHTLAPGISYLGSETLPVCSTQEWLSLFLNKSNHYNDAADFYKRINANQISLPNTFEDSVYPTDLVSGLQSHWMEDTDDLSQVPEKAEGENMI